MYKFDIELSLFCENGCGSDGFFISIFRKTVHVEIAPEIGSEMVFPYIRKKRGKNLDAIFESKHQHPRVVKIHQIYRRDNGDPYLVFAGDIAHGGAEFDSLRYQYVESLGFKKDYTPGCYRHSDFQPSPAEKEKQARRLKELFVRLKDLAPPDCFSGPASDSDILRAETQLQIELPTEYRRFINEFGATSWPEEIYGVDSGVNPSLVLADVVLAARSYERKPDPEHLLPFAPAGDNDYYCLDLIDVSDGVCPVGIWHGDPNRDYVSHFFVSFVDWLDWMLQERLEIDSDKAGNR